MTAMNVDNQANKVTDRDPLTPTHDLRRRRSTKGAERACFQTLNAQAAMALTPLQLGVLMGLVRHLLDPSISTATKDDYIELLSTRGMALDDARIALRALELSQLLSVDTDGTLSIPIIASAIEADQREFERRQAGWTSRRPQHQAAPSPALSPAAQTVDSLPEVASASATNKKRSSLPANIFLDWEGALRLASDALDTSPTIASFFLKDDSTVGVSEAYLESLKATFPGVDVIAQARRAALWTKDNAARRKTLRGTAGFLATWLGRNLDRKEIAQAVASESRGNGFGRGSNYAQPADVPAATQQASKSPDDLDFTDLNEVVAANEVSSSQVAGPAMSFDVTDFTHGAMDSAAAQDLRPAPTPPDASPKMHTPTRSVMASRFSHILNSHR